MGSAPSGVGGVTMSENASLINVRARHIERINIEPTALTAIPGRIAKFEAGRAVKQVFILPESERPMWRCRTW